MEHYYVSKSQSYTRYIQSVNCFSSLYPIPIIYFLPFLPHPSALWITSLLFLVDGLAFLYFFCTSKQIHMYFLTSLFFSFYMKVSILRIFFFLPTQQYILKIPKIITDIKELTLDFVYQIKRGF